MSSRCTFQIRGPNAAIADSTFCGLPQHQALARFSTNHVGVFAGLDDSQIELLASADADEGEVATIVASAEADFVEPSEEEVAAESVEEFDSAPKLPIAAPVWFLLLSGAALALVAGVALRDTEER